jgi:hypothetical protein
MIDLRAAAREAELGKKQSSDNSLHASSTITDIS